MNVPHTTVDDDVHALEWGADGPHVLLVHGLDGSAANWLVVGEDLGRDHRVLAPDLPGFGRTPLRRRRTSLAAHADLLADLVRARGDGPVVVAGNSMGGMVAVVLAGRHPELVAGAVLVAAAVPRPGTGFDATQLPALATLWLPGLGSAEAARRHAQEPAERVAGLLRLCVPPGTALPPEAVAEMEDVAAARGLRDHLRGWTGSARSTWGWLARREAFHAHADRLDGPGVLLTGEADPIIPRASEAAFLARHPTWTHVPLERVGHVPPLEAPQATAATIREVAARAGAPA